MSKALPVRGQQKKKERLQKNLQRGVKVFLKKKKTKPKNMVANDIQMSKKMKNKS